MARSPHQDPFPLEMKFGVGRGRFGRSAQVPIELQLQLQKAINNRGLEGTRASWCWNGSTGSMALGSCPYQLPSRCTRDSSALGGVGKHEGPDDCPATIAANCCVAVERLRNKGAIRSFMRSAMGIIGPWLDSRRTGAVEIGGCLPGLQPVGAHQKRKHASHGRILAKPG